MPPGAAEFAVGHRLQPDRLLLLHHVADGSGPRPRAARRRRCGSRRARHALPSAPCGRSRLPTSSARNGRSARHRDPPGTSLLIRDRISSGSTCRFAQGAAPAPRGAACARRGSRCSSARCAVGIEPRLEKLGADAEHDLVGRHLLHQEAAPLERPLRIDARLGARGVDAQHVAVALPDAVRDGSPRR